MPPLLASGPRTRDGRAGTSRCCPTFHLSSWMEPLRPGMERQNVLRLKIPNPPEQHPHMSLNGAACVADADAAGPAIRQQTHVDAKHSPDRNSICTMPSLSPSNQHPCPGDAHSIDAMSSLERTDAGCSVQNAFPQKKRCGERRISRLSA